MSAPLAKAILLRLKQLPGSGPKAPVRVVPDDNGAFAVQFNPTSLKISRQNNVDRGGATTQTQRRQNPSAQSATLTFDLEFDTAEGDDTGQPQDVRDRTRIVRQFAEPTKEKPTDPPPPIRFIWGTFVFTGLVTQLTEDLDYFSADGMPLRAKVSVTITEQNPDFEAKLVGAAARDASTATAPGTSSGGTGPGSAPTASPVSAALALGGESLQQLLTRLDADPASWRAAMAGLDTPLGLAAGAQVQLGAQVSAGIGLGASAGFAASAGIGATASLSAALGVGFSAGAGASAGFSAGAGVSAGAGEVAAGFALAESGGISASLGLVVSARVDATVASVRAGFEVPAVTASSSVSVTAGASVSASVAPTVDPRTQSYGAGIPLRASAAVVISGSAP